LQKIRGAALQKIRCYVKNQGAALQKIKGGCAAKKTGCSEKGVTMQKIKGGLHRKVRVLPRSP